MNTIKTKDTKSKKDLQYHLKELMINNHKLMMEHSSNRLTVLSLEDSNRILRLLLELVNTDPRFNWIELQNIMDSLYKQDKSITGFNLNMDFIETNSPNRALINHQINTNE